MQEAVREMLDRGTLWLYEDPLVMAETLSLIRPALVERLRFDQAVIQNRVLISDDLDKQETDLIYRVPLTTRGSDRDGDAYVFVLGEHFTEAPRSSLPLRL